MRIKQRPSTSAAADDDDDDNGDVTASARGAAVENEEVVVDEEGERLFDRLLRSSEDEKSGIFRPQRAKHRNNTNNTSPRYQTRPDSDDDDDDDKVQGNNKGTSDNSDAPDDLDGVLAELEALETDPDLQLAAKLTANVPVTTTTDEQDGAVDGDVDYVQQLAALGIEWSFEEDDADGEVESNADRNADANANAEVSATSTAAQIREARLLHQQQDTNSSSSSGSSVDTHSFHSASNITGSGSSASTSTSRFTEKYPHEVEAEGLVIVLNVVLSSLRNVRLPANQVLAINLIMRFARFVDDEMRLQLLIPYVVELLKDGSVVATVRAAGLHALTSLLR